MIQISKLYSRPEPSYLRTPRTHNSEAIMMKTGLVGYLEVVNKSPAEVGESNEFVEFVDVL